MKDITNNEMVFVLTIFKNPEAQYNANSISKIMRISRMGALKIAKRLEKEEIISSKELGKAKFYTLNLANSYAKQYIKFLLLREAERAEPYVKAWISEIRKVKNADAAIIFGSVIRKHMEANDIDVVFITNQARFQNLKKELSEIASLNIKKIHAIYQTKEDFIKNIKKGDKIMLNAMKGIIAFGEEKIIDIAVKLFQK